MKATTAGKKFQLVPESVSGGRHRPQRNEYVIAAQARGKKKLVPESVTRGRHRPERNEYVIAAQARKKKNLVPESATRGRQWRAAIADFREGMKKKI